MTKRVRIENADTSDYQVVVEVWDKGYPAGSPDVLVDVVHLDYPTSMTGSGLKDVYITSTRWPVVKEKPKAVEIGRVHVSPPVGSLTLSTSELPAH